MDVGGDGENHVFNIWLAKLLGLYQMLNPGTRKLLGRNAYHFVYGFLGVYLCVMSAMQLASGVYYWTNNLAISIVYCWIAENVSFQCYKIWFLIHRSDDIWDCLSITRYGFTASHNVRDRHVLDSWRARSVWLTTMLTALCYSMVTFNVLGSVALSGVMIPMINRDGTTSHYRQNFMKLYLFASEQTYEDNYYAFYVIDTLAIFFVTTLFLVFNYVLVTLCLGLCCQMDMVRTAFELLGHKLDAPVIDSTDQKEMVLNEHDLIYEELKTIIVDHQSVIKKYEEFLSVFGNLMLVQMFILSFTLIILWFCVIMNISGTEKFKAPGSTTVCLMSCLPPFIFEIYITCYLFDSLHDQKEALIFALYSSNWTQMNMKCKKLILLTMKMNNANTKQLKFTRTKIVNLQMFFKTMQHCYTVLSVLVNYIKAKY